ncbi:MAG: SH3 domain-containing protein [Chloroflexi bacterium]|nr:SH3 domain-containing protein [Chloroflexota bacterium]
MASKPISVVVAFAVLLTIASAQEYSIRANRGLNLRAAPNLDAAIADTVPAGAILRVVGKFNRWLKINRGEYEAWLADWVNYSRVDSSEPSGSPAPSTPIDNCCFVNRQCATNQEWVDGYWAYHSSQCPVSTQKPTQPSSQPTADVSSQVDNCCFVNRQCQTDADWLNGYWAFQNNQCPAPTRLSAIAPSRPQIEGPARFLRVIARSLDLLRDKAPEWYAYVISGMDTIAQIPNSHPDESSCSAFALAPSRRVEIETCYPSLENGDLVILAGTLVHEACHIHTHEAGIVYPHGQAQEELECGKPMLAVYKLVDPNRQGARVYTADEWRRVYNWFCHNTDYEVACQMAEIVHLYYD